MTNNSVSSPCKGLPAKLTNPCKDTPAPKPIKNAEPKLTNPIK